MNCDTILNPYRIWNAESGYCIGTFDGTSPRSALANAVRQNYCTLPSTYAVAMIRGGDSANHDEFGIFKVEVPEPSSIITQVTF
jgi:hypothetical protein